MPPPNGKLRVLFVCVGNACRSPMAEAIARQVAPDVMEPSSAGLFPLGRIEKTTQDTLLANGYSLRGLSSKGLARSAMEQADLIINMSGRSLDGIFDRTQCAGSGLDKKLKTWNVQDPYGEDAATYQRILEQLETKVLLLAGQLRDRQRAANS